MNSVLSKRRLLSASPVLLLLLPSLCLAHAQADGAGFMEGLTHPVFGFDHLLAMISVGIVSAQLGGANIWRIPVAFVSSMCLGGVIGILQWNMPWAEAGIAASVVFLGLTIIHAHRDTSPWMTFALVMAFGMFHGHAHGMEMPRSASPAFYTFGFLTSTSLLHVAGVVIGELAIARERLLSGLRYTGAGIAGVGVMFLLHGVGIVAL